MAAIKVIITANGQTISRTFGSVDADFREREADKFESYWQTIAARRGWNLTVERQAAQ